MLLPDNKCIKILCVCQQKRARSAKKIQCVPRGLTGGWRGGREEKRMEKRRERGGIPGEMPVTKRFETFWTLSQKGVNLDFKVDLMLTSICRIIPPVNTLKRVGPPEMISQKS
jgi:hypothetical protein